MRIKRPGSGLVVSLALMSAVVLSGCASDMRGGGGFHAVRQGALYRGAQPTHDDLRELKQMGVKTVVNLRRGDGERERRQVTALGMDYVHIPSAASSPDQADLAKFLSIVNDPARQPVFVHCRVGRDRTGLACATYRVTLDNWERERAVSELRRHQGANVLLYGNITGYVRGLDVAAITPTAAVAQASPLTETRVVAEAPAVAE